MRQLTNSRTLSLISGVAGVAGSVAAGTVAVAGTVSGAVAGKAGTVFNSPQVSTSENLIGDGCDTDVNNEYVAVKSSSHPTRSEGRERKNSFDDCFDGVAGKARRRLVILAGKNHSFVYICDEGHQNFRKELRTQKKD